MNKTRTQLPAVIVALVLLVAGAARAQTQVAPPRVETGAARAPEVPPPAPERPAPAPPTSESRAHVRSSHTVDVIAPGEQVDTILGRMHADRPSPPPRGDTVRPPPGPESRGPPGHESHRPPSGPGRSGPPRPGDDGRARPPSPRTDGAPPPPSSQQPPPLPPR